MAAYLIVDNEVTDQAGFNEYIEKIPNVITSHGGKYLVRGGATQLVEGPRTPHRVVVAEFESMEQVQGMVSSPEYVELSKIRERSTVTTTIIVEGV